MNRPNKTHETNTITRKILRRSLYSTIVIVLLLFIVGFVPYYRRQVHQCDLGVMGPIKFNDGIGRQSIGFIDCLKERCSIKYIKHRGVDSKDLPSGVKKIVNLKYSVTPNVLVFESPLLYPYDDKFTTLPNAKIKFAYSMLESTKIPQNWVKILNTSFDGVLVPDEFLVKVYQDSGVKIPIFVLPLGMYLDPFLQNSRQSIKPLDRPFVFGNLSSIFDRKNQILLLRAFDKAFHNNPNVQLVLNGRVSEKKYYSELQRERSKLGVTNASITTITLAWDTYIKEFSKLDCYVSVSKGEGFSIQPREAIAMGIPCIVTNNTGQSTICNAGHVYSLESPIIVPAQYRIFEQWYEDLGDQFDCEVNELAKAMQHIYDNYEPYATRARDGRDWVMQYQYENLVDQYHTIVKPVKVVLSDKNEIKDGVVYTDSETLRAKYQTIQAKDSSFKRLMNSLIIALYQ